MALVIFIVAITTFFFSCGIFSGFGDSQAGQAEYRKKLESRMKIWSEIDLIAEYINTEANMQWFEKLAFARKIKGATLREVESETGISNAYLSQLETGKIKDPGFFTMQKLLDFYNLEYGDIR